MVTEAAGTDHRLEVPWSDLFVNVLGEQDTGRVTASQWWPTLITQVDPALDRGRALPEVMDLIGAVDTDDVGLAQALVWRIGLITSTPQGEAGDDHYEQPPEDLDERPVAPADRQDGEPGDAARASASTSRSTTLPPRRPLATCSTR